MLIAIGYFKGDVDQATRLAGWLKELGPFPNHRLLVARDHTAIEHPFVDAGFEMVEEIVITDDVWHSWPQSANNIFRKIAKHIQWTDNVPYWLWIEPDVVPLRRDAFDVLAAEYEREGKRFSGDLVNVPGVDIHMSGVGIYPGKITDFAGEAMICHDLAFDMACRDQTIHFMHKSPHILHAWKHPAFEDMAEVQKEIFAIRPECLLFHADKSGSLIELLRAERNKLLPVPVLAEKPENTDDLKGASSGSDDEARESNSSADTSGDSRGGQKTFDILIKSYRPDFERLRYCLRALDKFASGFREIILVIPSGERDHLIGAMASSAKPILAGVRILEVEETGPGYLFQQSIKAAAHILSDADYIMHIDSDCVMTDPTTPQSLMKDGKVVWMMTPYDVIESPWREPTEKFVGNPVQFEFMRRFPILIPRSIHERADKFCQEKHGVSIGDYIVAQPYSHFSEFNALGAMAYEQFRDEIDWFDTTQHPETEWPKLVVQQSWSREELTNEKRQEFERILSTPLVEPGACPEAKKKRGPGRFPKDFETPAWETVDQRALKPYTDAAEPDPDRIIPWQSSLDSINEIRSLCARLAQFCGAPVYKKHVRTELAFAKVIAGKKYAVKAKKFHRARGRKYHYNADGKRIPAPLDAGGDRIL